MALQFIQELQFNNNQVLQLKIENSAGVPSGAAVPGRLYFDTADTLVKYWNGTAWMSVGLFQSLTGHNEIDISLGVGGIYTVSIQAASTTASGSMSAADKVKLNSLILISTDADIPHNPAGQTIITGTTTAAALNDLDAALGLHLTNATGGVTNPHNTVLKAGDAMSGLLSLSGAPTDDAHAATKKYVDDSVTSSGRPALAFDASTNLWPYSYTNPTDPTGPYDILAGDRFIISVAGTLPGGVLVNAGDTIIADLDLTTNLLTQNDANWSEIVYTAINASYSVHGVTQFCSEAEIDSIVSSSTTPVAYNKTVTVERLRYYSEAFNHVKVVEAVITFGAGGGSELVTHNFGTKLVQVAVYEGDIEVMAEVVRTSLTAVSILSGISGTFNVVVMGQS